MGERISSELCVSIWPEAIDRHDIYDDDEKPETARQNCRENGHRKPCEKTAAREKNKLQQWNKQLKMELSRNNTIRTLNYMHKYITCTCSE